MELKRMRKRIPMTWMKRKVVMRMKVGIIVQGEWEELGCGGVADPGGGSSLSKPSDCDTVFP